MVVPIRPFWSGGSVVDNMLDYKLGITSDFKGLLHCFLTCIEITGTNWYCFNLKNVENCKETLKRVKKL